MRIRISLPEDRSYAGRLEVLDSDGDVILGPFLAAGRAHDQLAAARGNASRNPLLAYGDTPLGVYAVRGVVESGPGTALDRDVFGAHGVVLLEAVSGPAALADAQGRFRLFIQGGDDRELHATAGAVRLLNRDQKQLVALVRSLPERVICEIVATAERGAQVVTTLTPLDCDPPALPDRPYNAARPAPSSSPANLVPGTLLAKLAGRTARSATRLFVVPERSGSGGGDTEYGGGGGSSDGGGDGTSGTGDTGTGDTDPGVDAGAQPVITQPVLTSTDSAPSPGADLTPPPDDSVVTGMETGSSLLSMASQNGDSSPYGPEQGGWLAAPPPLDPYTNVPLTGDTTTPYVGTPVETYSGTPDTQNTNSYVGAPNVEPYTGSSNDTSSGASPVDTSQAGTYTGYIEPDVGAHELTPDEIAALTAKWAQPDPFFAQANQSDSQPDQSDFASSPSISRTFSQDDLSSSTLNDAGAGAGSAPTLPQAGTAGAVSSQAYIPGFESQGVPSFARSPTARLGPNQWRGFLGETSFEGNSPLGGAFLQDLNTTPFLTGRGTPGNPGFFPVLDYQNLVTGNPTSVKTSLQGDINTPGDPARLDFYSRGYQELIGNLNPQKLNTAAQNLNTTPNDIAQRGYLAVNADDVGPFRSFLSQDVQNNPGNYPAGLTPEAAANQIVSNGLTTPQLANLQASRFGMNNLSPSQIERLVSPEYLQTMRAGTLGAMGESAIGGGAWGGVLATGMDAVSILANPDAHPDAARELATTGFLGVGSGATGSAISTYANSAISQSLVQSAVPGTEASALEPLLGRMAGGGIGGGPAAAVFTLGQMALSDQDYSETDYEAKGTRALVSGGLSAAVSAGVVGAIWGSEVPLLGNAVGFAVGFGGYLLIDWLVGDEVEGAVRSLDEPTSQPGDYDPEMFGGFDNFG